MTTALREAGPMAKKSSGVGAADEPLGPILFENLDRLGYVDRVPRAAEIARLVTEKTGKPMTRQRVAQILNAVRVTPETIDLLAKALGVDAKELIRRPKR